MDEGKVALDGVLHPHEAVLGRRHGAVLLDHLEHVGVHLLDGVVPDAESAI